MASGASFPTTLEGDVRQNTLSWKPLVCALKVVLPEVWLRSQLEDEGMPQKRHKPEGIVAKLRQVDVLVSQAELVAEAVRSIGVTHCHADAHQSAHRFSRTRRWSR